MKIRIVSAFKKYYKNFIIVLIVYALAKAVTNVAYHADNVPISLLGQLLIFASYIYIVIVLYKFFVALKSDGKEIKINSEDKSVSKETDIDHNTFESAASSLGAVYSFVIIAFVIIIILLFMGIGLGGR